MMTQQYFTDDEWSTLMAAPLQAVTATILADKTDPVSFLKEVRAAMQILIAEQQRTDLSNDLSRSLMQSMRDKIAAEPLQGDALLREKMLDYLIDLEQLKNAGEGHKAAIAHLNQVSAILASKVTIMQAQEFRSWLVGIARKVAEAIKEEGFFGIGGERISRQESAVLSDIEKALEVKA